MSHLPDGMIRALEEDLEVQTEEDEGGLDLEGLGIVASDIKLVRDFDVDRADTGITDYTWLSEAYQDPARLPDKPVDNGIPELQEAWGNRTDGIARIELRDRDAVRYQDAFQDPEDDDPRQTDKLAALIQTSMRLSAAGVPFNHIISKVSSYLSPNEIKRLLKPLQAVKEDHGLVGKVYVRASAYPRLERGKWRKQFLKAAKSAMYLIAPEGHNYKNSAEALGLQVIAHANQIDWDRAYKRYAPHLIATGRLSKTASSLSKREQLKRAFLEEEKAPKTYVETIKPRYVVPADRVSHKEAVQQILSHSNERQVLVSSKEEEAKNRKFAKQITSLVKTSFLSDKEGEMLLSSKQPLEVRRRMAMKLANRTKQAASFSGALLKDARVRVSAEEFAKAGAQAKRSEHQMRKASLQEDSQRKRVLEKFARLESRYQQAHAKIATIERAITTEKISGDKLRSLVHEVFTSDELQMVRASLGPLLIKGGYYDKKPQERVYQGGIQKEVEYRAPEQVVAQKDIDYAIKWASQQMNEGFASKDLDDLIDQRIAPQVREAAAQPLVQIRKRHEGLAGHLYVNAEAYVTDKTAAGCDKGGLRHRADGIPYVLSMPRCGGCVFKNADGVCQKYNKPLLDKVPEDAEEFRRQVLASHNQTDAEEVASLFSDNKIRLSENVDNPVDEFGLHNAALDNVETEEDSTLGSLEGIFFGGFEV